MVPHSFRERLLRGDRLIGTTVTLPSPEVAEILSCVGFDWLWIDTEHSPYDTLMAQRLLQAAGPGFPSIIRVPWADDVWIKKALDTGATGVIVPQVNTANDARKVVAACKYPPAGTRGVGSTRAHTYGLEFQSYIDSANRETAIIVQAEHIEAVDNIEEIAAVEGLDALMVGPYDLSASMGKIGQVQDPAVQQAIEKIRQASRAAGKQLGIFCNSPEAARPWMEKGFSLISLGTDAMHLIEATRSAISTLKT